MTRQVTHFMSEADRLIVLEEMDRWFFSEPTGFSEPERLLLGEIRDKAGPEAGREALTERLHGKLELAYSLNPEMFQKLLDDLRNHGIGVSHAITMSPHAGVFAGSELEMAKFRNLFATKGYLGLRRMPLEVRGAPHFDRLDEAARQSAELLGLYDRQGRLRDPVVPCTFCDGEWVRTRADFIRAVAGNANHVYRFDQMIERALEEGGRHFLLMQSGLATLTGNLFEGVIRNKANSMGISPIFVYPPQVHLAEPHPICKLLPCDPAREVAGAMTQSFTETVGWYESQLTALR
jgi:hypothetical protein